MKDPATLESALKGRGPSDIGLIIEGRSYLASPKKLPSDPMWEIDSYVCQEMVLKGDAWSSEPSVEYEHDTQKALSKVASGYQLMVLAAAAVCRYDMGAGPTGPAHAKEVHLLLAEDVVGVRLLSHGLIRAPTSVVPQGPSVNGRIAQDGP